jgi:predicted CoA-binding protein
MGKSTDLNRAAESFLALERIAVAGVSRQGDDAANLIYRKLRDSGARVFPLNPKADEVEGDPCWPDLRSLPEPVDGLVVVTPPEAARELVEQCAEAGVSRVWMHRSFGDGSVSREATERCRELGIEVIAGACPMMFLEPVDFGHRCIRWILRLTGGLPRPEGGSSA